MNEYEYISYAEVVGDNTQQQHRRKCRKTNKVQNSDNQLIQQLLGWQPRYPLQKGMETTYYWIAKQVAVPIS